MNPKITFVYAFRNRDSERVKRSLESLKRQRVHNFKVVFVDYGSDPNFAQAVEEVVTTYSFASYYYVAHTGLLWNKSKALNFGIQKTVSEYIFIADVDIIFHSETSALFNEIANPKKAFLFSLGYINEKESAKLKLDTNFDSIPLKHSGKINGMILAPKKAFEKVHGLDEFFHFYGFEDVDVFQRIENAGFDFHEREEVYFKHIWHPIYNSYNDAEMSVVPRLFNIKRINQKHYFYHKEKKIIVPQLQLVWGKVITSEASEVLKKPTVNIQLSTKHAEIKYFFEVQLKTFQKEIVKITITEADSNTRIKQQLKKLLKPTIENYLRIKEINDIVLSKIVYQYRDHNYSFTIAPNMKSIEFIIQLES